MGFVIGIALVWFIIEMLIWVVIAQFVSGWYVFFWFILAAMIGISLAKKAFTTISPMAQAMKSGVIPNPATTPSESNMIKSVALGLSGLLFLIPGILSDILALLLLIPTVQKVLSTKAKAYAMNNQAKMMDLMAKQMGGAGGFGAMGGNSPFGNNPFGAGSPFGNNGFNNNSPFGGKTVDGTAKDIEPNTKKLTSANDD